MIRIITNNIISTPQHTEPRSLELEELLAFEVVVVVVVVVELLVEDPLSLKLVLKSGETNLLPQFPQNVQFTSAISTECCNILIFMTAIWTKL